MPKVSIIIPAYNSANLIGKTIESVCNQTFKDWELLIIDDGSTDKTKEIIESFCRKDERIKYFYQANSGAPAGPKNTALKQAVGEYIAFLDHDDEWVKEKLDRHLLFFANSKNPNLGLVVSNAMIVNKIDNSRFEHKLPMQINPLTALLERNFIFCSSGVSVRREVFSRVGFFDENFKYGDDWDMWLRIALAYDFGYIHEPLYYFNRHEKTVTNNLQGAVRIKDYDYGLKKHLDLYKKYPKQLSSRLLTQGRICYIAGEKKKGILLFLRSILANPQNGRAYINLLFSLLGPLIYKSFVELRK